MVTSQQLLCYATSELPLHIPNHFPPIFRKGTSPANWEGTIDLHEIKSLLVSTIADLENDYNQGLFKKFNPYATRFGVTLNSINEAIFFHVLRQFPPAPFFSSSCHRSDCDFRRWIRARSRRGQSE